MVASWTGAKKALASDLDGTLLLHDGAHGGDTWGGYFLSQDLAAIRRLRASGALFGVCSGRPVGAIRPDLARGSVPVDFCIAMGGAVITDGMGEVLFERTIDLSFAKRLYQTLLPLVEDRLLVQAGDSYCDLGDFEFPGLRHIGSLDELAGEPIHGLAGGYGTEERAAAACSLVNDRFGDKVFAAQNLASVDVSPVGCSKGSALLRAKELFGVDLFAGIGDSYNDLTMLEAADVAYTFNRSPQQVQEAADVFVDTEAEAIADLLAR